MKRTFPVLAAVLALAAAGCGSSKKSSATSSTPATTATSPSPAAGGTVEVKMQGIAFSPKDITAKVGQTIKWTNADSVDHNVTATAGETFKSKAFGQGGTYSYKLDKAGTIKYVCTLHPGMEGTISVTP